MYEKWYVKMFYFNDEDLSNTNEIYSKILKSLRGSYPHKNIKLSELDFITPIDVYTDEMVVIEELAKHAEYFNSLGNVKKKTYCCPYYKLNFVDYAYTGLDDLNKKISKLKQTIVEYNYRNNVRWRKSKTITCKNCGVTLKISDILDNMCTYCKTDVRSKTVKDTLSKYNSQLYKLQESKKQLEKLIKKDVPLIWVVRAEYQVS